MTAAKGALEDGYIEIVHLLTRMAHRRRSNEDTYDFADFLAQVLAATAANVGGPDQLLAGRPGSWEAGHLRSLLMGTMGDRPQDWPRFRTEPLTVPLNVAELIESGDQHPGLLGLDDAIALVENRHTDEDRDTELEVCRAEVDAVTARYTNGFRSYAQRFTQAVEAASAHIVLPVRVDIKVDDNPQSEWWKTNPVIRNPAEFGGDSLILQLWSAAHDTVVLPNVDVQLDASVHQLHA